MFRNRELLTGQINFKPKIRYFDAELPKMDIGESIMEGMNGMARKIKVQNLAKYLMYDVETDIEEIEDYERNLKNPMKPFIKSWKTCIPARTGRMMSCSGW